MWTCAKKIQLGTQGVREEGKGVMLGEGRKESTETEAALGSFPIAP